MKVTPTPLPGLLVFEPKVFSDHRGSFLETYQARRYRDAGIDADFVQDNHSNSQRGTLRGLHFQIQRPQGKLVWVLAGSVYDVAVDLRRGSPTFKKWFGLTLSADTKQQLYVPPGFAHGFVVTSDSAEFYYKCTEYYDPKDEIGRASCRE